MELNSVSVPRIELISDTSISLKVGAGANELSIAADGTLLLPGIIGGDIEVEGDLDIGGGFGLVGDVALEATSGVRFGAAGADGTFKIIRSGANFIVQRHNGTAWVTQFTLVPAAANNVSVTNGAAGFSPQIGAIGSDTNVSLQMTAKGTGNILLGGYGGAEATAGAATNDSQRGYVTSEALTTAAGAAYTLTLSNTHVTTSSLVVAAVENGTNTQGIPVVGRIKVTASGTVEILVYNLHASQALNGTIVISFGVF